MTPQQESAAAALTRAEVMQFGDFLLANGTRSPYYFDLHRLQSYPRELREVANAMIEMMNRTGLPWVDRIAGIPQAAIPLATVVSYETRMPLITPRDQPKERGTGKTIDGEFKAGMTVGMIDDVVTSATTKLEFRAILEDAGLVVNPVWVVVDRQQGGIEALRDAGLDCYPLVTTTDLLEMYKFRQVINDTVYDEVTSYIAALNT